MAKNKPIPEHQSVSRLLLPAGRWTGELVAGASVSYGQERNSTAPDQTLEFSHIICGTVATAPKTGVNYPGVLTIFAPNGVGDRRFAGSIATNGIGVMVDLRVGREQFFDLARWAEMGRLRLYHFVVEITEDATHISSWGMTLEVFKVAPPPE